jgi:Zn-dependent peptidase ImmA (M78 family)
VRILSPATHMFHSVNEWDPWREAEAAGLDVFEVSIPPPTKGLYDPTRGAAAISRGLSQVTTRSVLTHELAHHVLGHDGNCTPRDEARQEERARRWAAVRLVTLEDLAAALRLTDDFFELAEILHVDPELLEVRIRWLTEGERRWLDGAV